MEQVRLIEATALISWFVITEKHICEQCTLNVQNAAMLLLGRTEDKGERENVGNIASTNTPWGITLHYITLA